MDMFDFEELVADMLSITDDQREDDCYLEDRFYEKFDIDLERAYEFVRHLMPHIPIIKTGLTKTNVHAFLDKDQRFIIMKIEAKDQS